MNDPHVERLHYKLATGAHLSFSSPPPLDAETGAFRMRLENGALTFEMKEHHATEETAKACVHGYIRAWEIATDLTHGRGSLRFKFERADIIDRNPLATSGARYLERHTSNVLGLGDRVATHASKATYLPPPVGFKATQDVETMMLRYEMYLDGREPLLSMANACMTCLEGSTGATSKVREAFCQTYHIDRSVREKLGAIVSERGGPDEARKLGGSATKTSLTNQEKQWVEACVKALIRRKAEYDADPTTPLKQITLSDFVPL